MVPIGSHSITHTVTFQGLSKLCPCSTFSGKVLIGVSGSFSWEKIAESLALSIWEVVVSKISPWDLSI